MVRSVGFRLGDVRRPADRQSMNSVESWFAQNSRSSSSDGNSGTGFSFIFVFGIGILFSSIHVPNGDYAHQRTADGEGHEQESPAVGLPKRVVPLLAPGVAGIATHDQGFVEEHALGLFGANSMPLPVLVRVCFVPFKTGTCIERTFAFHYITKYISAIYTAQDGPEVWSASASSAKAAARRVQRRCGRVILWTL